MVAKLADQLPGDPVVLSADRDMFRYGLPHAARRIFADVIFTQVGDEAWHIVLATS